MTTLSSAPVDIRYNGFQLPVSTHTDSISSDPVPDRTGRTVKGTRVEYACTFWVTFSDPENLGEPTTDARLTDLKRRLQQPGGELLIDGIGYGPLHVNGPGTIKDIEWGPKPTLLACEPFGPNGAFRIRWRVSTTIFDMCGLQPLNTKGRFRESGFKLSFQADQAGYGTRTYTGSFTIPQTRSGVNGRTLSDNASNYLDDFVPALPAGFRRTTKRWELSEDKCTASLTVVDEMLPPNTLPPFIVEGDLQHNVRCEGGNLLRWRGTISFEAEPTWGNDPALTYEDFRRIFKDRLDHAATLLTRAGGAVPIPLALTMESLGTYTRPRARWQLDYTFTLTQALLVNVIGVAGLFRPPPDSDYASWLKTMGRVNNIRSLARFTVANSDDAIVDLCLGAPPTSPAAGSTGPVLKPEKPPTSSDKGPTVRVAGWQGSRGDGRPEPENSFLDYQIGMRIITEHERVELKPMPIKPVLGADTTTAVDAVGGYRVPYDATSCPPSIIQTRAAPTVKVILVGRALRAGYPIVPPQLLTVGGVPAVPFGSNDYFSTEVVSNLAVPVVRAEWSLCYILPQVPGGGLLPLPNPMWGSPAGSQEVTIKGEIDGIAGGALGRVK